MMIWLIFAGMTTAVLAALLVPFTRKSSRIQNSDADFNLAVYRDQLQELERDQGRGLIGAAEAEAARNEISRRLLQVAKNASSFVGSITSPVFSAVIVQGSMSQRNTPQRLAVVPFG